MVSDRKIGQLLYTYSAVASGTHVYNAQSNEYIYVGTGGTHDQSGSTTEVNYDSYKPEVMSYSDYYPFLMKMPGREGNSASYRHSGQGQEQENEIYEGALSFEYRISDSRTGRFLSVDPLRQKYPYYSSYAFSGNRVIDAIEMEGLEPSVQGFMENYFSSVWGYDKRNDGHGTYAIDFTLETGGTIAVGILNEYKKTLEEAQKSPLMAFSLGFLEVATGGEVFALGEVVVYALKPSTWKSLYTVIKNIPKAIKQLFKVKSTKISTEGIDDIVKHFDTNIKSHNLAKDNLVFENGYAENNYMLDRLRKISKGEMKATMKDKNFYKHELYEKKLMDKGMKYEEAHAKSLKKYGAKETDLYDEGADKAGEEQMFRYLSGKEKRIEKR